jgi:hypothetical protein
LRPALRLSCCEGVDRAQHRLSRPRVDLMAGPSPQRIDQQCIDLRAIAAVLDLHLDRVEHPGELALPPQRKRSASTP